jgi:hypothetical protein
MKPIPGDFVQTSMALRTAVQASGLARALTRPQVCAPLHPCGPSRSSRLPSTASPDPFVVRRVLAAVVVLAGKQIHPPTANWVLYSHAQAPRGCAGVSREHPPQGFGAPWG